MAKFQKGHKFAKGGRRPGAGRKPKNYTAIKKKAEEIARDYIEKNIKPVLKTYGKVAKGYTVKKTLTTKSGNLLEFEDFVYDGGVLKHYMDRVIPPRAAEDKAGKVVPLTVLVRAFDPDAEPDPTLDADGKA